MTTLVQHRCACSFYMLILASAEVSATSAMLTLSANDSPVPVLTPVDCFLSRKWRINSLSPSLNVRNFTSGAIRSNVALTMFPGWSTRRRPNTRFMKRTLCLSNSANSIVWNSNNYWTTLEQRCNGYADVVEQSKLFCNHGNQAEYVALIIPCNHHFIDPFIKKLLICQVMCLK